MKKIGVLFGMIITSIVVLVFGFVLNSGLAVAMTQESAKHACSDLQGSGSVSASNYYKCIINPRTKESTARSNCTSKGGKFIGPIVENGKVTGYDCRFSIESSSTSSTTDTSTSSSPSSTSEDPNGGGGSGSTTPTQQGGGDASETVNNPCDGQASTSILGGGGCVDVGSDGNGIFTVLNVILQILTWGVGIAGTLGIVITGIQFITAKDDAAQLTKAKNRIIQIVIGLVIYAVMWAFLQWILPGGVFGS